MRPATPPYSFPFLPCTISSLPCGGSPSHAPSAASALACIAYPLLLSRYSVASPFSHAAPPRFLLSHAVQLLLSYARLSLLPYSFSLLPCCGSPSISRVQLLSLVHGAACGRNTSRAHGAASTSPFSHAASPLSHVRCICFSIPWSQPLSCSVASPLSRSLCSLSSVLCNCSPSLTHGAASPLSPIVGSAILCSTN